MNRSRPVKRRKKGLANGVKTGKADTPHLMYYSTFGAKRKAFSFIINGERKKFCARWKIWLVSPLKSGIIKAANGALSDEKNIICCDLRLTRRERSVRQWSLLHTMPEKLLVSRRGASPFEWVEDPATGLPLWAALPPTYTYARPRKGANAPCNYGEITV